MKEQKLDPSIMEFLDEGARPVQIIGDKTVFKNKKQFIEEANYAFIMGEPYRVENVYEDYVKWYDNPEEAHVAPLDIFEDGCYSWASQKNEEGAIGVYVVDVPK